MLKAPPPGTQNSLSNSLQPAYQSQSGLFLPPKKLKPTKNLALHQLFPVKKVGGVYVLKMCPPPPPPPPPPPGPPP